MNIDILLYVTEIMHIYLFCDKIFAYDEHPVAGRALPCKSANILYETYKKSVL